MGELPHAHTDPASLPFPRDAAAYRFVLVLFPPTV